MTDAETEKRLIERSLWGYSNWFLNQCTVSITPSRMIADIICEHTEFTPRVISNGVDINLFSPVATSRNEAETLCEKYQIQTGVPIILYVGRLDKDKQVDLLVKAASKVLNAMEVQLIIVGDGKQRDEIMSLSQSLGIHDRCHFPGFVPKSGDLPEIFRLADVFVTASEIEIQSSVVLEAMASGKPVVVVEASSMPEFVHQGINGYLVKPGDLEAMAEWILFILSNPEIAKRMGQAGRATTEDHSNQAFISAHERLYQSLIIPV